MQNTCQRNYEYFNYEELLGTKKENCRPIINTSWGSFPKLYKIFFIKFFKVPNGVFYLCYQACLYLHICSSSTISSKT